MKNLKLKGSFPADVENRKYSNYFMLRIGAQMSDVNEVNSQYISIIFEN